MAPFGDSVCLSIEMPADSDLTFLIARESLGAFLAEHDLLTERTERTESS
ncbi:hypothetical protein ACFWYW_48415 [Nonomuraea sp. NPDC059023]